MRVRRLLMSAFNRLSYAGISDKVKTNPMENTNNSEPQIQNGPGDSES
jgi:hypothetical protein